MVYSRTQLAAKFARWFFRAHNRKGHGVHSPFVFSFIKFIKNDRTNFSAYAEIENIRKNLLKDERIIEVEDFGAGSGTLAHKKRLVKDIAKTSLKPKRLAQLMYRMVQVWKPKYIVELGTSLGTTTAYFAKANPEAQIITIEGSEKIAAIAAETFEISGAKNIQQITGDFNQVLPEVLAQIMRVDFAFVDGNHRYGPTMQYFHWLLKHRTDNTFIIFDDVHWSSEMEQAWEEIKAHPAVTLSISLFFIGIVFFDPAFLKKQHFAIRP